MRKPKNHRRGELADCVPRAPTWPTIRPEFCDGTQLHMLELGCLDAPAYLPAGASYRYLNIDTVREVIRAWPAVRFIVRSPFE